MNKVLIAGIGNVLLGDDGVGPYVVRCLESAYLFPEGVKVADLGTPALDFVAHIVGLDALIVVDAVDSGQVPVTITLYRREELMKCVPAVRMDTHSPALTGSLVAGGRFLWHVAEGDSADRDSTRPRQCGWPAEPGRKTGGGPAVRAILAELARLGVSYREQQPPVDPGIWWEPLSPALASS